MTTTQTFELTLFPGDARNEVLVLLSTLGIEDFVESAAELDADDTDWEEAYDSWSQASDAPLVIYRSTRDELLPLIEALNEGFNDRVRLKETWISDTLWQEAWEPGFESLETERFFIASEGQSGGEGKIRIVLKEAPVFGSGQHATTQALIRLMEAQDAKKSGSFLDVGTGTGVLCFAAHHLGFKSLCGTDIEDIAIENAKENATLNSIPLDLVLGSLPEVSNKWDAIACNILPPTLTHLLKDLKERLAQGADLYLAGFNEANAEAVGAEIARLGLTVREELKVRGWIAWRVG